MGRFHSFIHGSIWVEPATACSSYGIDATIYHEGKGLIPLTPTVNDNTNQMVQCYNGRMVIDVQVGDTAHLRKPHPCGSYEWRVVRIGLDIGMICLGCQRRVLIPRSTFNKRVKSLTRPPDSSPSDA